MQEIINDVNFNLWQGIKIRLRAVQPEDWEEWHSDSPDSNGERLVNTTVDLPQTEEMDKTTITNYIHFKEWSGRLTFTIETVAGQNVGWIDLNSIDYINGTFSIGLRIYRPFRGQGFGAEAFRILLRYAFLEKRLEKCNTEILSINAPCFRMHQKLGFMKEGLRRRNVFTNGKYYDELLLGLTKEEFEKNESCLS